MDEYFDHILSSASWSGVNAKESSFWGQFPESATLDENGKDGMINSNQCLESVVSQDTQNVLTSGESDHGLMQVLLSTRSNKSVPSNLGDMSRSSLPFVEAGHGGCNGNENSEFVSPVIGNGQMLSSIPNFCLPPTPEDLSSLLDVTGEDRILGFDLQGEHVNNDSDFTRNAYDALLDANFSASFPSEGKLELCNNFFSTLPAGMTSAGMNSRPQATPATISGSCNGTAKPRPRARRGQATDPHSIAERLRREKIAERMKNLQELVPNSNKTDKASMLDEILDYVKFLQLQVKVLSVSRQGGKSKSNGSSMSKSPSADQADNSQPSPDQAAFEREVVKLMESSVARAMQYLQSKDLCLMPLSLATAISDGKTSSSSSSIAQNNVGRQMSSDANSLTAKRDSEEGTKELKSKT